MTMRLQPLLWDGTRLHGTSSVSMLVTLHEYSGGRAPGVAPSADARPNGFNTCLNSTTQLGRRCHRRSAYQRRDSAPGIGSAPSCRCPQRPTRASGFHRATLVPLFHAPERHLRAPALAGDVGLLGACYRRDGQLDRRFPGAQRSVVGSADNRRPTRPRTAPSGHAVSRPAASQPSTNRGLLEDLESRRQVGSTSTAPLTGSCEARPEDMVERRQTSCSPEPRVLSAYGRPRQTLNSHGRRVERRKPMNTRRSRVREMSRSRQRSHARRA